MARNRQGRLHVRKGSEAVPFMGHGYDRDKGLRRQLQEAGAISARSLSSTCAS